MNVPILLFLGTAEDVQYLPKLKACVGGATVFVLTAPVSTVVEIEMYCTKRNITGVISTNTAILKKLLGREHERASPSLSNYAGSYIKRNGIEYVFIEPLEHLVTVPYGSFLARRYISKLSDRTSWSNTPAFAWEIVTPGNAERIFESYQDAFAIAIDIETYKLGCTIRCIGYTAIFIDLDGTIRTHSCVLPVNSEVALVWMRKFNWELKAPKIFQRGKYDITYLSRYNAVPFNYLWDTATIFHCWYSELPKDLAALNAFFVREAMYWKDLANTTDLMEYYRYNALDTWATANVWVAQLLQMPEFARRNYLIEFPLQFPCHLAEMTGIARDPEAMVRARAELDVELATAQRSMNVMVGVPSFNVNSPVQMKVLLKVLGCGDLVSTDEKNLMKAAFRHPLNNRIIETVLKIRELRKLKSTYLRTDDDITKTSAGGAKEFAGRILYAINPDGTDTGRLASREHHFWCGLQIQNIPRGTPVKQTFVSDPDFLFGECDSEQAETRDTAYISGDKNLIAAVSGTRDFHSLNASAFFGVPYDQIYSDTSHKTLDKILRDLAKRVNHGANYNMGAAVLVDTMGLTKIYQAARMLQLPKSWNPRQIAEYLLEQFHRTYPDIARTYYPSVVHSVNTTRMLVSATGWTRYCFGNPDTSRGGNKHALNAYIAHSPQNLNAQRLNMAWLRVFDFAISPEHSDNFKLCAQIHDSILFQYRIGHEYLVEMVRKAMEIPITIRGCDNVVRTYTVPAVAKYGKRFWSELE